MCCQVRQRHLDCPDDEHVECTWYHCLAFWEYQLDIKWGGCAKQKSLQSWVVSPCAACARQPVPESQSDREEAPNEAPSADTAASRRHRPMRTTKMRKTGRPIPSRVLESQVDHLSSHWEHMLGTPQRVTHSINANKHRIPSTIPKHGAQHLALQEGH